MGNKQNRTSWDQSYKNKHHNLRHEALNGFIDDFSVHHAISPIMTRGWHFVGQASILIIFLVLMVTSNRICMS